MFLSPCPHRSCHGNLHTLIRASLLIMGPRLWGYEAISSNVASYRALLSCLSAHPIAQPLAPIGPAKGVAWPFQRALDYAEPQAPVGTSLNVCSESRGDATLGLSILSNRYPSFCIYSLEPSPLIQRCSPRHFSFIPSFLEQLCLELGLIPHSLTSTNHF